MKTLIFILISICIFSYAKADLTCNSVATDFNTWWGQKEKWTDMGDPCVRKMRSQIRTEIEASMTYLSMGAYFSRDTVNRPGFAKFFIHSAREEREHGIKLIEYLLMRGELAGTQSDQNSKLTSAELKSLISIDAIGQPEWNSGVQALKDALKLEAKVTDKIRDVIKTCEGSPNDYHLVDYLTGVYLEEQYHGQRELAGKISTLDKMTLQHGAIGEFLFDKKLLD